MSKGQKRLGYWLSEKKSKKLSIPDIEASLRSRDIEPVKVQLALIRTLMVCLSPHLEDSGFQIDIEQPLEIQGPFDGILHKLTDFIAQAELGNADADKLIKNVQDYAAKNPEMTVIDSIDSLRNLINRYKTYQIIDKTTSEMADDITFVPNFVALQSNDYTNNVKLIREASVAYPAVCKPIVAHGSSSAHQMTLVFNDQGLSNVVFPCVVQSFVNHNAILYKLFVIGRSYFLVERPSIKNFNNCNDYTPIHFDGGEVSKSNSVSKLTLQDADNLSQQRIREPCPKMLSRIVEATGKAMGLNLFGIDVVIDADSGRYAIVDVNAFPGYDGVEDFSDKLAEFVREKLDQTASSSRNLNKDCLIQNANGLIGN